MAAITFFAVQCIAIFILTGSATAQISSGYATYSNTDGGVCPGGGSGLPSVSMNAAQFANGAACGQCVQISGTGSGAGKDPVSKTSYIASVGNVCPQCAYGDIDVQTSGDGKFGITWSFVGCPGAGRKLIEGPFKGDTTVYRMEPKAEQTPEQTEQTEEVAEKEAATPAPVQSGEHFIVHQTTEHLIIHQAPEQSISLSETESTDSVQEISTEAQAPAAEETQADAAAPQDLDGAQEQPQEEEKVQEVQKASRRLLMN